MMPGVFPSRGVWRRPSLRPVDLLLFAALLALLEITDHGREFAEADIDTSKKLFGDLIAAHAPLIKAILRALRATNDGTLREGFFLDLLRRGFSADEARRQLDIAIDWGRYGELFEYDAESGQLVLDPGKVGT